MDYTNFWNNILHPTSKILNSKNKNHWIAMVRGIMINKYDWTREQANIVFTYQLMQEHFKEGLTPMDAIKEEMTKWE